MDDEKKSEKEQVKSPLKKKDLLDIVGSILIKTGLATCTATVWIGILTAIREFYKRFHWLLTPLFSVILLFLAVLMSVVCVKAIYIWGANDIK